MNEGATASKGRDQKWEAGHWQQLQELFYLAETAPPGERTRILYEATADPAIIDRVLALLSATDEAGPTSASGAIPQNLRLGPYLLLRHLGTGGLGSVYLAERMMGGAVLQCAVKVLSMHAAGPEFEARFQREQQVFSTLNHLNITRMLDAGISETGQPYLAMEFIDGVDIVRFCDQKHWSVEQRLRLFLQVCDAVAYAHQNLAVHLDLKPSNILVTEKGVVKLLDFGTSKILSNDSLSTTTVLATPAYASPEQLTHQPVTTTSDVYGLGVVLAELLCGQRPWADASATRRLEDALQDREPGPLANFATNQAAVNRCQRDEEALRDRLRGDLSSIAAHCLRNRPADRYRSVDALRDDLQRHLEGRPVLAHRQTLSYRVGKLVRRKKLPLLLSAAAALLVFASLGYAGWRQQQALIAARRAVQMQQFLSKLFTLANTYYTGKPAATVPELLRLGVTILPQMIHDPTDRVAARLSLGESMLHDTSYADARPLLESVAREAREAKLPAIQAEAEAEASIAAYKLGDLPSGLALSKDAVQVSTPMTPVEVQLLVQEAYSMQRYEQGLLSAADVAAFRSAVEQARRQHVEPHSLAVAVLAFAEAESRQGNLKEQVQLTQEATAIFQSEPWAVCDMAEAASMLGFLQQQTNDLQGSVVNLRASYQGLQKCQGPDARDTLEAGGYLGLAMVPAKQTKDAIPLLENVIPRLKAAAGTDSLQLKGPLLALARSYLAEKRYVEAEATASDLFRLVDGKINPMTSQMGAYQSVWARALSGEGRYREALVHAELAERAYAGENSPLPAARDNAALTRALVVELRGRVASEE